jgi:hypothetical protein
VDVGRRSDDEKIHVLERRQGLVHRDELDLPLMRQRGGNLLGDPPRVPEPRLVDDERSHRTPPVSFSPRLRRGGAAASVRARIRLLEYRT